MAKIALLLGAGFSKAVSTHMPLLGELGEELCQAGPPLASPAHRRLLRDNPEALLTLLSQDLPWKPPDEYYADLAQFLRLTKAIQSIIVEREMKAFSPGLESLPSWLPRLVEILHTHRIPVVTLNYDTIIERVAGAIEVPAQRGRMKPLNMLSLYQGPLAYSLQRTTTTIAPKPVATFHLMKLHGSVNWYYSGPGSPMGDQVFFGRLPRAVPLLTDQAESKEAELDARSKQWAVKDKQVFLIPPVTEKTAHFQNGTLRSIWRDAAQALRSAERVYCIGCSLPPTDLAMQLFLSQCDAVNHSAHIVNRCGPGEAADLVRKYCGTFKERTLHHCLVNEGNPVEEFVEHLEAVSAETA